MKPEQIDNSLLMEMEEFAFNIALSAGQLLLENFGKPLELEFKGENNTNPVTNLDKKADEHLRREILDRYPDHAILCEESGVSGEGDSPFLWVLDPLDGTSNYINKFPFFAVSVGLLWKGKPVVGAIYVPIGHLGEESVYHACLGNGAYCNDEQIMVAIESAKRPLVELPVHGSGQFKLSANGSNDSFEARNLGSIALELTLAASGIFQLTFFGGPKIWDVAAGALLVQEAGGLVYKHMSKDKAWKPLTQFQADANTEPDIEQELKGWSAPVIAGMPATVKKVAEEIKISGNSGSLLSRIFH